MIDDKTLDELIERAEKSEWTNEFDNHEVLIVLKALRKERKYRRTLEEACIKYTQYDTKPGTHIPRWIAPFNGEADWAHQALNKKPKGME